MRCLYFILFLWTAAPAAVHAQGLARALEPRPISAERWTESFSLLADLTSGAYIKVNAVVTNVGIGDGKAACSMVVTRPGHEPLRVSHEAGDDWNFDETSETLKVGGCALSNTPQGLRVRAVFGDVRAELEYAARVKRHPVPDGFLSNGESFYEYDVQLPWSTVKARLFEKDVKVEMRGFGFVDHSRSTAMPRDLAYRWFRFLGLNQGESLMFRVRIDESGEHCMGWWWRQEDPGPTKGAPSVMGLTSVPEGGGFAFTINDGKVVYEVQVEELLLRHAPIEELGFLGKMIRPWLGRPETRTYRAQIKKGDEQWQGLLEIATNYD